LQSTAGLIAAVTAVAIALDASFANKALAIWFFSGLAMFWFAVLA